MSGRGIPVGVGEHDFPVGQGGVVGAVGEGFGNGADGGDRNFAGHERGGLVRWLAMFDAVIDAHAVSAGERGAEAVAEFRHGKDEAAAMHAEGDEASEDEEQGGNRGGENGQADGKREAAGFAGRLRFGRGGLRDGMSQGGGGRVSGHDAAELGE
jgi:hypothetical protein